MAKTIIITGCSTGLGFAAARAFAERGYRVIATVRSPADAGRVEAEGKGGIHSVLCDVTVKEQVAELPGVVRRITGDGVLDGLINNAGVLHAPCPVEFMKLEDIRAVFDVNVFGMMAVTIALLPLLGTNPVRRQPGRIINISSIEGKVASPFIAAYPATKHAIEGFSSALRRELRLFGIKVIIVAPGGIQSEMFRKHQVPTLVGTAYEGTFRKLRDLVKQMEKESATPEEVARFLVRVFETRRPKARYAHWRAFMDSPWTILIPDLWWDAIMGRMLGLKPSNSSGA
ncbi:MAG TPA: SDR family NAD(P)-dependent oxidoreductase [Gemmataceae bacterium]|nr:SDR family NAD(P)-dependent oxidoreductase [Gemmataceae bacterium]